MGILDRNYNIEQAKKECLNMDELLRNNPSDNEIYARRLSMFREKLLKEWGEPTYTDSQRHELATGALELLHVELCSNPDLSAEQMNVLISCMRYAQGTHYMLFSNVLFGKRDSRLKI